MAYPGENEHMEYLQYVEQMSNEGQTPLPKDQWRQQRQTQPVTPTPMPDESRNMVIRALMMRNQ